jgi:hypothetical protein
MFFKLSQHKICWTQRAFEMRSYALGLELELWEKNKYTVHMRDHWLNTRFDFIIDVVLIAIFLIINQKLTQNKKL